MMKIVKIVKIDQINLPLFGIIDTMMAGIIVH